MTNKHKNMLNFIKNRGNINYETSKRGFDNCKWQKNVHRQTEILHTGDGSAN